MKKGLMSVSLILSMLFLISVVSATSVPTYTIITGKVYNSSVDPLNPSIVEGAHVTVNCSGHIRTTETSNEGAYNVNYTYGDCPFNSPFYVEATKDNLKGNNYDANDTIDSDMTAIAPIYMGVGVVFMNMIPEFGAFIGGLTLVSAVALFFVIRRK
jgi:hypothetical protein